MIKPKTRTGRIIMGFLGLLILAGLVNFAPMISRKTIGMQKFENRGLTLWAEPGDADEVAPIARRIHEARERIGSAVENTDDSGIEVIIYPGRKVLHRKTIGFAGAFLPDWYIGKNTTDFVLITSPDSPGPSHNRESIEKAVVHEYVHLLTDRRNRKMGYWLKEGFALFLAEQRPASSAVRIHSDITFKEFSNPNAIQFAEVGGYSLAYTLMQYLEETIGWKKTLGFLEPGSSIESVTGLTGRELFEDWKSWLEAATPGL